MNDKDRLLREKMKADEAACDRAWDDCENRERREWLDWCADRHIDADRATAAQRHRYRVKRGWEFVQLAAWDLQKMENDFAETMLGDGLDQEIIVGLLLSMRHHNDPLYVGFSEGEIAEVSATVDLAWAKVSGLLEQFRDDDE